MPGSTQQCEYNYLHSCPDARWQKLLHILKSSTLEQVIDH